MVWTCAKQTINTRIRRSDRIIVNGTMKARKGGLNKLGWAIKKDMLMLRVTKAKRAEWKKKIHVANPKILG